MYRISLNRTKKQCTLATQNTRNSVAAYYSQYIVSLLRSTPDVADDERPLKYKFSLRPECPLPQLPEALRTQISNITWKQCKKCCFNLNSTKPHHNYGFVRWARSCIMEKDEKPNRTSSQKKYEMYNKRPKRIRIYIRDNTR